MRFLKLDTGVIDSFDHALGREGLRFDTGQGATLRRLARHRGWRHALAVQGRALLKPGAAARQAVAGNIARKRIRMPGLFGEGRLGGLYGYIKRVQAAVLRQALEAELEARNPDVVVIYNGSNYPESVLEAASRGRSRVFIEAGFFPGTLQIDPKGLNGANSVPRDPAFYLDANEDFAAEGYPQSVNNRPSKTAAERVELDPGYIFVPFQVPSDMQVTQHSPWVRDMAQFLDVICDAADRHPDLRFVIKEHPSFKRSVVGLRAHPRVRFANGNVTSELIRDARAVITLNSTVGLEALLLERPVITLGEACYNIEGLVRHAPDPAALDAALADPDQPAQPRLLRQVIGYLWNRYLVHGTYADLPANLADVLKARAG